MKRQDGFTLIEVMVGIIILALALAMILPSLANLTGIAGRAQAESAATLDAKLALKMIESDLRRAVGSNPTEGYRPNTQGALEAVLEKPSIRLPVSPTETDKDLLDDVYYHDLTSFNGVVLTFFADVANTQTQNNFNYDQSPGAEKVSYMFYPLGQNCTQDKSSKHSVPWCLWRQVESRKSGDIDPATGKLKVHLMAEMVMRGDSFPYTSCYEGGPKMQRMFCFKQSAPTPKNENINPYAWSNWTSNCRTRWFEYNDVVGHSTWSDFPFMGLGWFQMQDAYIKNPVPNWTQPGVPELTFDQNPDMALETPPTDPSVVAINDYYYKAYHTPSTPNHLFMMDTIVGVGIVMPATVTKNGATGMNLYKSQVALRNRLTPVYQRAIMCGSR